MRDMPPDAEPFIISWAAEVGAQVSEEVGEHHSSVSLGFMDVYGRYIYS